MAEGVSTLRGVLDSEDTRVMISALQKLGVEITHDLEQSHVDIVGSAGRLTGRDLDIFVANSGTTIRFLSAMCAAGDGSFRLRGIERMHERPIGDLVDALRQQNVDAIAESLPAVALPFIFGPRAWPGEPFRFEATYPASS